MVSRGQSFIATWGAWDTVNNKWKVGDAVNQTAVVIKDGAPALPTNTTITELSAGASNAILLGTYAISLTSTETNFNIITAGATSSSTGIYIVPTTYSMEQLPVFAPGTNQGIVTIGSGAGQITVASGFVNSNVQQWVSLPPVGLQSGLVQVAIMSGAALGVIGNIQGNINGSVNSVASTVNANVNLWGGTSVFTSIPPDAIFSTSGTAQAATANTITLASGTLGLSNTYNSETIFIYGATTGAGQSQNISAYNAATKVVTISGTWAVTPGSGANYTIAAFGPVGSVASVVSGVNTTQIGGVSTVTSSAMIGINVVTFAGNPQGVINIDRSTRSIAIAVASNQSTTTSITISTITPAMTTASQFVGRIVNFDENTLTTNLRGQSTNIISGGTSSGGNLQVTALTDVPQAGDTFSIT